MLSNVRDVWQDGDRRGAGANDGHLGSLDALVTLLSPELRVDDLP